MDVMSLADARPVARPEPLDIKTPQWTDEDRDAVEKDGAPSLYGADYPWI